MERVPESLIEAAADLGARRWRAVRDVVLPLALPGVVAGSIFTFSLTLGDYITPILVGGAGSTFIGNVVYSNVGIANNVPFAAALTTVPVVIMVVYLLDRQAPRRLRGAVEVEGIWTRLRALRVWAVLILLFLFIPIVLIFFYAFNTSNIESWPIPGLTHKWFARRGTTPRCGRPLVLSLQAGLAATALALVLGSLAAFAIHRMTFFGRDVVSLLFVLPLALPGIITGIALNSFFNFNGITLSICDDRRRPHHLLHRGRLQQRARATCAARRAR